MESNRATSAFKTTLGAIVLYNDHATGGAIYHHL